MQLKNNSGDGYAHPSCIFTQKTRAKNSQAKKTLRFYVNVSGKSDYDMAMHI